MKLCRFTILLSLTLCSPLSDELRADNMTIRGNVTLPSAETVLPSGIVVTLNGQGLHEVTLISSNGSFTFGGIPRGIYELTVTAPGRQAKSIMVEASESAGSFDVWLGLGPPVEGSESAPPANGAVVDVKELRVPRKARAAYEEGVRYLNKNQAGKAEKRFLEAISRHPDYFQAHFALGVVYTNLGQLKEAQDQFAKAVEIAPDNESAQRNFGLILLFQKQPASAIRPLLAATRLDPSDARSFDYLGEAYFQARQPNEARQNFEKCLVLSPMHPAATFRLGEISAQARDYTQALAYFKRVLKQNPPPLLASAAELNIEKLQSGEVQLSGR